MSNAEFAVRRRAAAQRPAPVARVPRAPRELRTIATTWAVSLVAVTIAAFAVILSVGPSLDPEAVTVADDVLAVGALLTLGGAVGAGFVRSAMAPWLTIGFGGFLAAGQVSCLVVHGAPATAGWFWMQNLAIAALFVVGGLALRRG